MSQSVVACYTCSCVALLFALAYSFTYYSEYTFKKSAVEGECRIIDAAMKEEGEGQCDESWLGETTWEMPCLLLNMEIKHEGAKLPEEENGIWTTFHATGCTMATTQKPAEGKACSELLVGRVNKPFPCSYIPEVSGAGGVMGVTDQGVVAAPLSEVPPTSKLFWLTVISWALAFLFCSLAAKLEGDAKKGTLLTHDPAYDEDE